MNLNDMVLEVSKILRRIIGEDICLSTQLAPDLRTVKADPMQVHQVIMNLAVNARDAMPKGGELRIETANIDLATGQACPGITHPGAYVMLAISDTGIGMDAPTKSHLFEPFFTTKEKGKGTGLGLSIVYGVVRQNGGDVLVHSELGKGATFKIYLPVIHAQAEPSPASNRTPVLSSGTETILVVEDEESVRKLVSEMLRKQGYTILEAPTPGDAVRIAGEYPRPIHLMITKGYALEIPRRGSPNSSGAVG